MNLLDYFTHNKKTFIGVGVILILIATFVFSSPRDGVAVDSMYQTEAAGRGTLSTTVGATGTVRAYQSTTLTWQTSGIVESVNAQLSEAVKTGDVLAVLGQASLPKNVVLAEADLVSAQQALNDLFGSAETDKANAAIALRDAQEAYDDAVNYRELLNDRVDYDVVTGFRRVDTPFGKMKVPVIRHIKYYPNETQKAEADQDIAVRKAQLDDAQRTYDHVKDGPNPQDVAAAEARVAAAQATLNRAKIVVPFDGVITDENVQQGDQVNSGELAFQVDDLSHLLIDLEASEVDINSIAVGQEVAVKFDAVQGKDYQGVVVEVAGAGTQSAGSVNFRVTVELVDADDQVKPGMTASVVVQVRNVENALLVPNRAVRVLDGQRFVYVLVADGALHAVDVRLGAISDTYSEVVGGGLDEGAMIVLNPPASVDVGSGNGDPLDS